MIKTKKINRALVLGYGHNYFDKRVYRKCILSLSEISDEVHYVVHQKRDENVPVPENVKDIYIPNFPIRTIKRTIKYDPFFWNILKALKEKFDLIYVHDLPGYIFPAKKLQILKNKNNARLLLDFHEYIPDIVFPSIKSTTLKIAINRILFERPCVKIADGIVAVSKFVQKKVHEYDFPNDRTFVLPNYAHEKENIQQNRENAIAFVGLMNPGNGPKNIERFINRFLPDTYKFYFIGSDKKRLRNVGISEKCLKKSNVKTLGFLPYKDMLKKISEIKFTLSHMNPTKPNVIHSLPNKLYDSLAQLSRQQEKIRKNNKK